MREKSLFFSKQLWFILEPISVLFSDQLQGNPDILNTRGGVHTCFAGCGINRITCQSHAFANHCYYSYLVLGVRLDVVSCFYIVMVVVDMVTADFLIAGTVRRREEGGLFISSQLESGVIWNKAERILTSARRGLETCRECFAWVHAVRRHQTHHWYQLVGSYHLPIPKPNVLSDLD